MRISVVVLVIFFLATTTLSTYCQARFNKDNLIQLIRTEERDCLSWRLAVEANNRRNWRLLPELCVQYVGYYMQDKQYRDDCEEMADAAIEYAKSIKPNEKDVWVFDIDETTLCNLEYYARDDVKYGSKPYNRDNFQKWIKEGKSTAVPAVLKLYNTLLSLRFKTFILTEASDELLKVRSDNLKKAGYDHWEKIIFKKESERGVSSVICKSNKRIELVNEGYKIVGNVGDQWSDILGTNAWDRTFKVPNLMYYLS